MLQFSLNCFPETIELAVQVEPFGLKGLYLHDSSKQPVVNDSSSMDGAKGKKECP